MIKTMLPFLGNLPEWITAIFDLKSHGRNTRQAILEVVTKRMTTSVFGLGRNDERIFEVLRMQLPERKRAAVDLVMSKMKDYESDLFRITVADIQVAGNASKEFTPEDIRVKYLEGIADEFFKADPKVPSDQVAESIVSAMRARRLIVRSETAEKALELWANMSAWVKKNILAFFDVQDFSELTEDKIEAALAAAVARNVARRPDVLSQDEDGTPHARIRGPFSRIARTTGSFFCNLFDGIAALGGTVKNRRNKWRTF